MQGTQSLGQEDPLEKEMATRSSILAWEVLAGYSPWGCKRVGHNLATKQQQQKGHRHHNETCPFFSSKSSVDLIRGVPLCQALICQAFSINCTHNQLMKESVV